MNPLRSSVWKEIVATLSGKCPQLKVLQVGVDSGYFRTVVIHRSQGDWPVLPALTTLRFAEGVESPSVRCILAEIKAPQLYRVEFRDCPSIYGRIPEIPFSEKHEGTISFSIMGTEKVRALLRQIPNAADLEVELDLDSLFDGDPEFRAPEIWERTYSP